MEGKYPFALLPPLQVKFGYETVEHMLQDAEQRFSLLYAGILDMPCAPLLITNGMDDSIFPIEDSLLALQHGKAKEARFFPGRGHMGFLDCFPSLLENLVKVLGLKKEYRQGSTQRATVFTYRVVIAAKLPSLVVQIPVPVPQISLPNKAMYPPVLRPSRYPARRLETTDVFVIVDAPPRPRIQNRWSHILHHGQTSSAPSSACVPKS